MPKRRTANTRRFKLFIDLDEDAFIPYDGIELARILRNLACQLDEEEILDKFAGRTLKDIDGTPVGRAEIVPVGIDNEILIDHMKDFVAIAECKGEAHPDPVMQRDNTLREMRGIALTALMKAQRHIPREGES